MDEFEPTAASEATPLIDLEAMPEPRPTRGRRSTLALGTAFVVLAALISTTVIAVSSSSHETVAAMLNAAPANTRDAGTAQFTGHLVMTTPDLGTVDILDMNGAVDFKAQRENLTISGPGQDLHVRLIDGVEYLEPAFSLPNGAHWVRITRADTGIGSANLGLGSGDPSSGLDFLAANTRDATAVGHETIDGVAATHYTFTLDLTTVMAALGTAGNHLGLSAMQTGLDALRAAGIDLQHVPAAVWLDSASRVLRFDFSLVVDRGGVKFSELQSLRYSHFGAPVAVSAPSAGDVVPFSDVPDLFQRMAQPAPSTPA